MPIILDGTKGETFPSWTTGTRPATPNTGQTGYNTTLGILETYNGTAWVSVVANSDGQIVASAGTAALPGITTTGDTNTGIFFPAADTLAFTKGGAESARIDASGNLLVGRTSTVSALGNSGTPTVNAQGSGFGCFNGVSTVIYGGANGQEGCYFNSTAFRVFNASNVGMFLTNGATAWSNTSDERLKDIIEPINDAINKVSSLRAVIGKYKLDEQDVRRSFLIAQDVQAVLPEAVTELDGYLGVAYTDVIPLLVASIKELSAKLDAAEARIAALEAK